MLLPFGISLVSKVCQCKISKILRSLLGCEVYQNDVVYSGIMKEYNVGFKSSAKVNQ